MSTEESSSELTEGLREQLIEDAQAALQAGYTHAADLTATIGRSVVADVGSVATREQLFEVSKDIVMIAASNMLDVIEAHVGPTSVDQLRAAFAELEREGVLCLECIGEYDEDATTRSGEIVAELLRAGEPAPTGLVYFCRFQAEMAARFGTLEMFVLPVLMAA